LIIPEDTASLKTFDDAVNNADNMIDATESQANLFWYLLGKKLNTIYYEDITLPTSQSRSKYVARRFRDSTGLPNKFTENRIRRAKTMFIMFDGLSFQEILNVKGLRPSFLYDRGHVFAKEVNDSVLGNSREQPSTFEECSRD